MTKAGEDEVALAKSKEAKPSLSDVHACNLALGLGLLYLGKQQAAEIALATLAAVPGSFGKVACMVVETCAYAGTGNVLKVQSMLHACSEHVDTSKEDYQEGEDAFQAVAAMGIAMIAMGEDISTDMALRSFNHLLQYGEPVIRRAVPLAIALLCVSNTKLSVLDTLSKLSHDPDAETAYNAILAMGLVGAGTNQARIAGMLRTLAHYYHKDANALFMVRLAQGILHTGKGSITLSPFHTERSLMSPVAVSGLLSFLFSCLNVKNTILKSSHYMLFHLALPMYPRILCTYDEDLNPVSVPVRVGQAVDVVGQAGLFCLLGFSSLVFAQATQSTHSQLPALADSSALQVGQRPSLAGSRTRLLCCWPMASAPSWPNRTSSPHAARCSRAPSSSARQPRRRAQR